MSVNKIEQVKKDKGFKVLDLVIYGVIAAMITAAFLVFYFISDRSQLDGVRVMYNSTTIYEYQFGVGELIRGEQVEYVQDDEVVILKINLPSGYNVLEIDTKNRTADIIEADCNALSCVHMPTMKDNSGTIICQTHYLVVTPLIHIDDGNILF